jgi:DNA-binding transcriptional ArsR family regulator
MTRPTPTERERVYAALAEYGRSGTTPTALSTRLAMEITRVRAVLEALREARAVEIMRANLYWRVKRGLRNVESPHGRAARVEGSVTASAADSSSHVAQAAGASKSAQDARAFRGAK